MIAQQKYCSLMLVTIICNSNYYYRVREAVTC